MLLPGLELGARLRELRKARGWTQDFLAGKMERGEKAVTQGEVSRWEKGETYPEYNTVVMWAKALELPVSAFLVAEESAPDDVRALIWAASQRAEALREMAVAARLAEENARDLSSRISPGGFEKAVAEAAKAAYLEVLRQTGAPPSGMPQLPRLGPSTDAQGEGSVDPGKS